MIMEKQLKSVTVWAFTIAVVLFAFVVVNTVYLHKTDTDIAKISDRLLATQDQYIKLTEELKDEKRKMAFMAHVLDIRNVLSTFHTRTSSYNTMDTAYLIARESFENDLDPFLVLAVIKTESSFINTAVSHKGAIGLMQILPNTAHYVAEMHDHIQMGSSDELFDPDTNILIGINYLSYLNNKFEDQRYALIAYNMGPSNLLKKIRNGETPSDRYYRTVMKHYRQIMSLSGRV
jgi:soluble lytic murein transglycosylase